MQVGTWEYQPCYAIGEFDFVEVDDQSQRDIQKFHISEQMENLLTSCETTKETETTEDFLLRYLRSLLFNSSKRTNYLFICFSKWTDTF